MRVERGNILVVDDDEVAVMAVRRALRQHRIDNPVVVANDGLHALELLRSGAVGRPYIILLDINMPRMTGLEFLSVIRADRDLSSSVVFVMTTSDAPEDIHEAYSFQVAGYILKEDAYRSIGRAIKMLDHYLETVVLDE